MQGAGVSIPLARPRRVSMTVVSSDSGGDASIQAGLKASAAHEAACSHASGDVHSTLRKWWLPTRHGAVVMSNHVARLPPLS